MKKIVIISEVNVFGLQDHILNLLSYLLKQDCQVYFLYGKERLGKEVKLFLAENPTINSYEIDSLKRKIGINDLASFFKIKKILRSINPDIVHCHSSKAGLSGRIAAKMVGSCKVIYSPHGYYFLDPNKNIIKSKIYFYAEKLLSKMFTDCTIATSRGEYSCYKNMKLDQLEKCVLIENGIEDISILPQTISSQSKEEQDFKNIVWMGRFTNQKNPMEAVAIFNDLVKINHDFKFYLYGDGDLLNACKKHVENKEYINKKIFFMGKTDMPNESIARANILLSTSLYEGLPYTLIKALCLSKPIVASDVVGNSDCVLDNDNGYLYDLGDINTVVKKIDCLLRDNERYINFSNSSRKIYLNRFSFTAMMSKYLSLYFDRK